MDIILHLGGNPRRAQTAAALAAIKPKALVVISSEGGNYKYYYDQANIDPWRIQIDNSAWDTVTNFTHTYKLLRKLNATKIYVVTDSSHMPRAMAIADMVWGCRAQVIPYPYQDDNAYKERDAQYISFDRFRAFLWRLTGILLYHKDVRAARKGSYAPSKGHALIEIGI